MTEINYSLLLRQIVGEYLEQRISRVEYLSQRRGVLDRIDHELNGNDDEDADGWLESDTTQPAYPDRLNASPTSAFGEEDRECDD